MPIAATPPHSYYVQAGDTLSQLALDYYGDASRYPGIASYNHVANPDLILVGEHLVIPGSSYVPRHTTAYTPRHAAASAPVTPRHSAAVMVTTAGIPTPGDMAGIARYLAAYGGLTKAAAAGVAACIWGESNGYPGSAGSGGFGLIGWTGNNIGLPAGYWGGGNTAYDMRVQLNGVIGYIRANGGTGVLNAQGSAVLAAQVFSSKFERPLVLYSDIHYGTTGDPNLILSRI